MSFHCKETFSKYLCYRVKWWDIILYDIYWFEFTLFRT